MPVLTVESDTGQKITFYAPEGTTDEQAMALAPRMWNLQQRGIDVAKEPEADRTIPGHVVELGKGTVGGILGLVESAATGAAQLLPEEQEQTVRQAIADVGERVQAPFEPEAGYEDALSSKFGRALGSTIPFLATAPLGIAALPAGIGLGVAAGSGEAIQRAVAQGATEEEISRAGRLGTIPGALEFAAPARILARANRFLGRGVGGEVGETLARNLNSKISAGMMRTRGGRITQAALEEATQEAISETAQNLIARGVYDPEQGAFAGIGEAAGLGGGVGAVLELIIGRRGRVPDSTDDTDVSGDQGVAGLLPPPAEAAALPSPDMPVGGPIPTGSPAIPMPPPEGTGVTEQPMGPDRDQELRAYRAAEREAAAAQPQQELFPELGAIDATVETPELGYAATNQDVLDSLGLTMDDVMPVGTITAEQERQWLQSPPNPEQVQVLEQLAVERVAAPEQVGIESAVADTAQQEAVAADQAARQAAFAAQEQEQAARQEVEEEIAQRQIETPANPAMALAMQEAQARAEQSPAVEPEVQEQPPAVEPEVQEQVEPIQKSAPPQVERVSEVQEQVEPTQESPVTLQPPRLKARRYLEANPAWVREITTNADVVTTQDIAAAEDFRKNTPDVPVRTQYGSIKTPEQAAKYYLEQFPVDQALRVAAAESQLPTEIAGKDKEGAGMRKAANMFMDYVRDPANGFSEQATQALDNQVQTFANMVGAVRPAAVTEDVVEDTETPAPVAVNKAVPPKKRKISPATRGVITARTEQKAKEKFGEFYSPELVDKAIRENTVTVEQLEAGPDDAAVRRQFDRITALPENAVEVSSGKLDSNARAAVQQGNLRDAVGYLTSHPNPVIAETAKKLQPWLGTTKVEMVEGLTNNQGQPLAGLFRPKDNTIQLSADIDPSVHTLLHEAAHAATMDALANRKSHPSVKKLQKLYNRVKNRLEHAYAAQSLEEFVAEAYTNPEFKHELDRLTFTDAKTSAWKRFVNAVADLLGWNARKLTDKHINNILSPAPNSMNASDVYMKLSKGQFGAVAGSLFNNGVDGFVSDNKGKRFIRHIPANLKEKWGAAPRQFTMDAISLPNIVDTIKDKIPAAKEFYRTFQLQDGLRTNKLNEVHVNTEQFWMAFKPKGKWSRKDREAVAVFEDVVEESTREQVDPTKKRSDYENVPKKVKVYDRLQTKWRKLSSDQQKVYTDMRNAYSKMYDEIVEALDARLKRTFKDEKLYNTIRNRVVNDIVKKGRIEPYFPLDRQGQYWVEFKWIDPDTGMEEYAVEAFETPGHRDDFRKELEMDPTYVEGSANNKHMNDYISDVKGYNRKTGEGLPPTTLLRDLYELPELKGNAETREQILELLINTLPEQTLLKGFRHRKGFRGARKDAIQVFSERMPLMINSLANITYQPQLTEVASDIADQAKRYSGDQWVQDAVKAMIGEPTQTKEMLWGIKSYLEFSKNPYISKWARHAKAGAFGMTLGGNVSAGVVNLTNLPIVVQAYLGGIYGYKKTAANLTKATQVYLSTGMRRSAPQYVGENVEKFSGFSISNWDYDNPPAGKEKLLRHIRPFADAMKETGLDSRTLMAYQAELDDPSVNWLRKLNSMLGVVMSQSERMNRQVSGLGAYMLEMQKLTKKKKFEDITDADVDKYGESAAQFALHALEHTNSSSLLTTAPRIAQTDVGAVAFLYRRYPSAMMFMQARMFNALRPSRLRNVDPDSPEAEEIRSLRRGLAFLFANSGVLAGVAGVPLYGIAQKIFDWFVKEDDEEDFDTLVAQAVGAPLYSGLLSNVTGMGMSDRIAQTDLVWRYRANYEPDSWIQSASEFVGGPALGIITRWGRGYSNIKEGETWRGIEGMAPAFLSNVMKGMRYADEGALSMRGDPILDEVEGTALAGQFFGFAPTEYIRQLEQNALIKRIDRNIAERRTKLLRRYYVATRNGDGEAAQEAMEDMITLSTRHPEVAIDRETISRSMAQHRRTSQMARTLGGITVNRRRLLQAMMEIQEFE